MEGGPPGRRLWDGATNRDRAKTVMGVGFISVGFFAAALFVFLFAAITATNPVFGGSTDHNPISVLGVFVLSPFLTAFGGALPAVALGAGWTRALLASGAAVAVFFLFLLTSGVDSLAVAVSAGVAPAIVALAGAAGSGIGTDGVLAVLVASAGVVLVAVVGLSVGGIPALLACAAGWVVLPAVAGLFQP